MLQRSSRLFLVAMASIVVLGCSDKAASGAASSSATSSGAAAKSGDAAGQSRKDDLVGVWIFTDAAVQKMIAASSPESRTLTMSLAAETTLEWTKDGKFKAAMSDDKKEGTWRLVKEDADTLVIILQQSGQKDEEATIKFLKDGTIEVIPKNEDSMTLRRKE
jgi:hypothetical protein